MNFEDIEIFLENHKQQVTSSGPQKTGDIIVDNLIQKHYEIKQKVSNLKGKLEKAKEPEKPQLEKELAIAEKELKDIESNKKFKYWAKSTNWTQHINSQSEAEGKLENSERSQYDRELRLKNKQEVEGSSDEGLKNIITNFLHNNVSTNMDAINLDVPAFKASMEGEKIPGGPKYLSRWKHIVVSMLAKKGYKQSDAQNFLNNKTYEALGLKKKKTEYEVKNVNGKRKVEAHTSYEDTGKANKFDAAHQGNYVVVSQSDYKILKDVFPDEFKEDAKGNMIVSKKFLNKQEVKDYLEAHKDETGYTATSLSRMTKTSDFTLKDAGGAKIFVSFKEVDKSGGSQDNQVDEVVKTLDALKSNYRSSERNKAIAVIKGENIEKKLKVEPSGKTVYTKTSGDKTNYWFQPFEFVISKEGNKEKKINVPRVMTNSQWLAFLKKINRNV